MVNSYPAGGINKHCLLTFFHWFCHLATHFKFFRKSRSHLDDLRKSEDDIKWKNLAPRERMRLKKMQQADREAKRLSEVARVQLIENQQRKSRIHDSMNKQSVSHPYLNQFQTNFQFYLH